MLPLLLYHHFHYQVINGIKIDINQSQEVSDPATYQVYLASLSPYFLVFR